MSAPFLSICIPVYGTEPFLSSCLESLVPLTKAFNSLEIIVLSDCSTGRDEKGLNCKQIVKQFSKSLKKQKIKVPVWYLENKTNLGTNETRRNLVVAASGKYVFMLDSDDSVIPEALLDLIKIAQDKSKDYDIINGNHTEAKSGSICEYKDHEIFFNYIVSRSIPGFLWLKLIKRELYLEAYDKITPTYCNFGEDFLVLFFITWFAKSYYSSDLVFYNYNRNAGITSAKVQIDNLERWEKVCSTASVFSIIYTWIKEQTEEKGNSPLSQEETDALGQFAVINIGLNLKQLKQTVIPELQADARTMLGEYWGENLVASVEKKMGASESKTETPLSKSI